MALKTVLVIDDHLDSRTLLSCLIELAGFNVLEASSLDEAGLLTQAVDFAVVDVNLGWEQDTHQFVRDYFPDGNYVRYTGQDPTTVPDDCRGMGVFIKGHSIEPLIQTLENSLLTDIKLEHGGLAR